MNNFNDFISNITEYYDNILSNKVRLFYDTEDKLSYKGKDLSDKIALAPKDVNPSIVAGLEKVMSYNRSHVIRNQTPTEYFTQYKNEASARKLQNERLLTAVNGSQGETV